MNVVVSGLGVWSPYGPGTDRLWEGLVGDEAALHPVDRFSADGGGYRTALGATIPAMGSERTGAADRTALTIIDRVLDDALADAAVDACGNLSPYDVALLFGVTQALPLPLRRATDDDGYVDSLVPEAALHAMGSARVLERIAQRTGARGQRLVISTACASGTSSIGLGYDLIRRGRARRVLAGGLAFFSELSFSGFNILRVLSKTGCRPFDRDRDGVALGDAFVVVVLEDEALAARRGKVPRARILGFASANEAFHATAPDPTGTAAYGVMRSALGGGTELLERLDYVNAHGTGTPANDKAELLAIGRLAALRRNDDPIAVSSTKGHHGHALGAAGSIEFAATVLAIEHGRIPATLGLRTPAMTEPRVQLVGGGPIDRPIRVALSNSFAFGGNVASVAVGAP